MKAIVRFKDFPDHKGIPGHQGGSLPRIAAGNVSDSLDAVTERVKKYSNNIDLSDTSIANGKAKEWLDGMDRARSDLINKFGAKQLEGFQYNLIKVQEQESTASSMARSIAFSERGAPGLWEVDTFDWQEANRGIWSVSATAYGTARHELTHIIDDINAKNNPALHDEWYNDIAPKYDKTWRSQHISKYAGSRIDYRGASEFLAEASTLYTTPGYKEGYLPAPIENYLRKFYRG